MLTVIMSGKSLTALDKPVGICAVRNVAAPISTGLTVAAWAGGEVVAAVAAEGHR